MPKWVAMPDGADCRAGESTIWIPLDQSRHRPAGDGMGVPDGMPVLIAHRRIVEDVEVSRWLDHPVAPGGDDHRPVEGPGGLVLGFPVRQEDPLVGKGPGGNGFETQSLEVEEGRGHPAHEVSRSAMRPSCGHGGGVSGGCPAGLRNGSFASRSSRPQRRAPASLSRQPLSLRVGSDSQGGEVRSVEPTSCPFLGVVLIPADRLPTGSHTRQGMLPVLWEAPRVSCLGLTGQIRGAPVGS
jgi:hypothetical protein